jgi:hypothetical protein
MSVLEWCSVGNGHGHGHGGRSPRPGSLSKWGGRWPDARDAAEGTLDAAGPGDADDAGGTGGTGGDASGTGGTGGDASGTGAKAESDGPGGILAGDGGRT